jgi:hypothetical protein
MDAWRGAAVKVLLTLILYSPSVAVSASTYIGTYSRGSLTYRSAVALCMRSAEVPGEHRLGYTLTQVFSTETSQGFV